MAIINIMIGLLLEIVDRAVQGIIKYTLIIGRLLLKEKNPIDMKDQNINRTGSINLEQIEIVMSILNMEGQPKMKNIGREKAMTKN